MIKLDATGQSQVYRVTRDVRAFEHSEGTLWCDDEVFFVLGEDEDDRIFLAYAGDGSPTNGNDYLTFDSLAEAQDFVERFGLFEESETIT